MFEQLHQYLPLGDAVNAAVRLLIDHNSGLFDSAGRVIEGLAGVIESVVQLAPAWVVIAFAVILGWRRLSWRFAVFAGLSLLLIAVLGYWPHTIVTLGLTLSATLISLALGVPLGILAARNRHVYAVLRPVLDFMQTMPAFVYLIPAVMLLVWGACLASSPR